MSESMAHRASEPTSAWLTAIRRSLPLVAALTVLGALLGMAGSFLAPREYQASSQVILLPVNGKDAGEVDSAAGIAQSMVSSYAQAVTSEAVLTKALEDANSDLPLADAIKAVRVTVPSGTVVLDIVVTDKTAAGSAALANAITNQFVKQAPALMPKVSTQTDLLQPRILRQAIVPKTPSSLGKKVYLVVGAFLGLSLGLALALVRRKA